ncbi:MAG TPA: threonine/serine dehydratase [Candidatus Bathyarchaeia archaeon]|nr:threonine/serine dehydratase [Candidatus Bathyarchaeia archaeon]
MRMISLQAIRDARKAIAPFVKSTPLVRSQLLSNLCGGNVFLKLENLQVTNSFKIRGAFNRLLHLSLEEKTRGIITASAGNHGQAVAYAARKLNFPAKIVVPKNTPKIKIDGIKKYGVGLVLFGDIYDEAEQKAKDLARKDKLVFVSPYNDELIIAGHGTIGLEIIEALPNAETVIVPVGGGGLISGISIAIKNLKPTVQIIGVQSEASPVIYESLKAGKIVDAQKTATIAEGLSGGIEKGSITFEIIQKYVDRVLLVKEETIRHAVYLLWDSEKQVAEGSGAAAIAPIIENKNLFGGKTVVAVITGGNIDAKLFQGIKAYFR